MAARHVKLCQDVTDYILNQTYSFTVNVGRRNVFRGDLSDTQFTNVIVTPGDRTVGSNLEADTRDNLLKQYQVRVHILNFLDSLDISEEDDAQLLTEEIENSLIYIDFKPAMFLGFTSAEAEEPPFDVDRQNDQNFYYKLMTLVYLAPE